MENVTERSLARTYPKESKIFNAILFAAFILFLIGIFAPILTFKKFFIFSNRVSIISGLFQLLAEGRYILFALIFVFSIVLPVFKLALLFRVWNLKILDHGRYEKLVRWLSQYGKWSMLDVFVAAVLIVTVKLGAIANVDVHLGLYAFAASVVLTMVATSRVMSVNPRFEDSEEINALPPTPRPPPAPGRGYELSLHWVPSPLTGEGQGGGVCGSRNQTYPAPSITGCLTRKSSSTSSPMPGSLKGRTHPSASISYGLLVTWSRSGLHVDTSASK
jgi:paraquat-inducible protein A